METTGLEQRVDWNAAEGRQFASVAAYPDSTTRCFNRQSGLHPHHRSRKGKYMMHSSLSVRYEILHLLPRLVRVPFIHSHSLTACCAGRRKLHRANKGLL